MSKQHYSEAAGTSMNQTLQPCDANNFLGEHTAVMHPLFHGKLHQRYRQSFYDWLVNPILNPS